MIAMRTVAAVIALALTLFAAPAMAAVAIGMGSPTQGNCYPFSCFAGNGGSLYQELYSAGAFPGAVTIDSVSFLRADNVRGDGSTDVASYDVSFWYAAGSALSTTGASNLGTLLSDFGSYSLGGAMPAMLTLQGAGFNYNPGLGDLLMEVKVTGLTEAHPLDSFLQTDIDNSLKRYVATHGSTTGTVDGKGLVTIFDANISPAPEPSTWALMLLGLGGLGALIRARRYRLAVG